MPDVVWTGEPGDARACSAQAVADAADRLAPMLVEPVAVVLPPTPELVVSIVACERIGIAPLLMHPLDDLRAIADAKTVITASAFVHRGDLVFLKERVDDVAEAERVIVYDRTGWMPLGATLDVYHEVPMRPGRDVWFPTLDEATEPAEPRVGAPSLREVIADPSCVRADGTIVLREGYLEPSDADYVGASGTSLGSRTGGRLS